MLIAQITDLHMRTPGDKAYGIIDPAAFLGPAVRALNALTPRPDCVLITGDLTDLGKACLLYTSIADLSARPCSNWHFPDFSCARS